MGDAKWKAFHCSEKLNQALFFTSKTFASENMEKALWWLENVIALPNFHYWWSSIFARNVKFYLGKKSSDCKIFFFNPQIETSSASFNHTTQNWLTQSCNSPPEGMWHSYIQPKLTFLSTTVKVNTYYWKYILSILNKYWMNA